MGFFLMKAEDRQVRSIARLAVFAVNGKGGTDRANGRACHGIQHEVDE